MKLLANDRAWVATLWAMWLLEMLFRAVVPGRGAGLSVVVFVLASHQTFALMLKR